MARRARVTTELSNWPTDAIKQVVQAVLDVHGIRASRPSKDEVIQVRPTDEKWSQKFSP